MYIAKKGNVILTIQETEQKAMKAQGYDIFEEDKNGKRTKLATGTGKTVSAEAYEAAQARIAELEAALKTAEEPEKPKK